MSATGAPDDRKLAELSKRHYRPTPMTPPEQAALLARARLRADDERTTRRRRSRLWAWGAAGASAACGLILLLGPSALPLDPPSPQRLDSLLIPIEAYAADTSGWALGTEMEMDALPADYLAIEDLLLAR